MKHKLKLHVLLILSVLGLMLISSVACATDWFRIGAMETAYRETNTQDVEIAFNILLDEVLRQYDEASVIKSYKDFNVLLNDMESGELDACMASSLEMVDHLDEFHDGYYYSFTNNSSSVNEYYLVTRKQFSSVDQLARKSLALSKILVWVSCSSMYSF